MQVSFHRETVEKSCNFKVPDLRTQPLLMRSFHAFHSGEAPIKSTSITNILIVDDHPITCKGYTMLLKSASKDELLPKVEISMAHTSEEAYKIILDRKASTGFYDLVLLDIRLPSFPKKNIFNGEDIGKLIRRYWEESKILVVTSLNNHYRLQTILKSLNPEGLILKSEICDKNLILAVQKIITGVPFYSPTVLKLIKNQFIRDNEITLPERKFLYLLSTGVQSKEIPNHLPWSNSKVEKQKRILKEKLGVEEKSSWGLIHKAKELGII